MNIYHHIINLTIALLFAALTVSCQYEAAEGSSVAVDSLKTEEAFQQMNDSTRLIAMDELKTQNELLLQRSRFTTGGVVMVLGIVAMLAFLAFNSRWTRRLELKNRQLQRERNVVVAQNKQLEIERDRAEAASRAKTAFIQSMTHEIRTPLNGINGFTQILTMAGADISQEERDNCCERIEDNTRLLTNILDDLILISELESSTELPEPEECSAVAIVALAAEAVRPLVVETVQLKTTCEVPDDQMVSTYPRMIQTILSKLLDNAAKFTREGCISVELNRDGNQLHFTVADTGVGIPPDKKEFIFERFSKLDKYAQGTGLGLTIARMMAEHLGGSLTLDTDYHGGSKFDLFIPVK